MNGVPFRLLKNGTVETFYLSTERSTARGQEIARQRRAYYAARRKAASCARDVTLIAGEAEIVAGNKDIAALAELARRQDKLMEEMEMAEQDALEAATHLTREALAGCHGADAAIDILDTMTDEQVRACVRMLETGVEPEDFFPSRATPPKPNSTGPSGAAGSGFSSPPDSAPKTLPAAE